MNVRDNYQIQISVKVEQAYWIVTDKNQVEYFLTAPTIEI